MVGTSRCNEVLEMVTTHRRTQPQGGERRVSRFEPSRRMETGHPRYHLPVFDEYGNVLRDGGMSIRKSTSTRDSRVKASLPMNIRGTFGGRGAAAMKLCHPSVRSRVRTIHHMVLTRVKRSGVSGLRSPCITTCHITMTRNKRV